MHFNSDFLEALLVFCLLLFGIQAGTKDSMMTPWWFSGVIEDRPSSWFTFHIAP